MKRYVNVLPLLFSGIFMGIFLLSSCSNSKTTDNKAHQHDEHEHDHDHAHDDHDHSHDDHDHSNHEHDHSHDDHDHAHDDHDHSHDDHDHDHEVELEEGQVSMSDKQFKELGLSLHTIEFTPYEQVVRTSGKLLPALGQEQVIVAKQAGIVSLNARNLAPGKAVRSGDLIAHISDKNLVNGEQYSRLKLEHDVVQNEFNRAQALMRDSLISTSAFNEIRLKYEQLKVAMNTYSNVSEKGSAHIAPLTGYLKNLLVTEGAFVNAGDVIAVVTTNKQLRLQADVPVKYASFLPTLKTANIKTATGEQVIELDQLNGKLVSYGRNLDEQSHLIPVLFEFDNQGDFYAGGYVEVYLKGAAKNAFTVPLSALVEEQGMYFVFVREKPTIYRKKLVQVQSQNGKMAQIKSGLALGNQVVTNGAIHLKLASMNSAIPHSHAH
jgi:cobalt-zinc-cadmium efflux system membrane fusion protein